MSTISDTQDHSNCPLKKGKTNIEVEFFQKSNQVKVVEYISNTKLVLVYEILNITFEITSGPDYPAAPPVVLCTSYKDYPSFSDGRDLLQAIVQWDDQKTCSDIISAIPSFLETAKSAVDAGEFHLLSTISLKNYENKPDMQYFFCTEIDPLDLTIRRSRIIIVTNVFFLLLEPCRQDNFKGMLVFWASLFSLDYVKKLKNSENTLVFEWTPELSSNYQMFKLKNANALTKLVCDNLKKLGTIVHNSFLLDIEPTIDKIKIYSILRNIERLERLLETFVDDEKANLLIALYQKAVEYYSAIGDSKFELYLTKLHGLLKDQRVLGLLCTDSFTSKRNRIRSMEVLSVKETRPINNRKSMELSGYLNK